MKSLKWIVLKRLLNKVDYFLTIGRANRQFYERLGCRGVQMISAPYCIENRRFAEQATLLRSERARLRGDWGIPKDAFCFLFVGKFIAKKRPLDLVVAVRRLRAQMPELRPHILWVGSGELGERLRKDCNVRFDEIDGLRKGPLLGVAPPASFAGFLNQSEVGRAYAAADALVLPSDARETWGLVVNEAMSSGLPCVLSAACGSADDLVTPIRPDLCFPVGDMDALMHSLMAVVSNPPDGELLRQHVAGYDVARTVESVETLYRQHQLASGT